MSGVRRRNGRCSGGLGGESGGRNSHKITLEFGEDLKKAMEALAPMKERKVGAKAEDAAGASDTAEEAGLNEGMAPWVYPGCRPSTRVHEGGVDLVDCAREENKARAVIEIYLETGAIPTRLTPFRYH